MEFELAPAQRQIRQTVSEFVDREVIPVAAEIDATGEFPAALIKEMGELGLLGMPFPEEYGGAGLSYHAYVSCLAEISRGSGALGTILGAHTSLAAHLLFQHGTTAQKRAYLTSLSQGEDIGAFALSEADAGSDITAMDSTVQQDGDGYRLEGTKMWVSNGTVADTVIVVAKTDPEAGRQGLSSFVVRPEEDDGYCVEGTEAKLGDRGCPTAALRFDSVYLPAGRCLGEEGDGFYQALHGLNCGRISVAARGVGIAQAALDASVAYAEQREQFDQPIGAFQSIRHKLANMDTKLQTAKMLMHRAADRKIRDEPFVKAAAQAKLHASEVSREVANQAIQVHGGYGYTTEYPVERFYRDAKLNEIYEGTSEILRNTIADRVIDC